MFRANNDFILFFGANPKRAPPETNMEFRKLNKEISRPVEQVQSECVSVHNCESRFSILTMHKRVNTSKEKKLDSDSGTRTMTEQEQEGETVHKQKHIRIMISKAKGESTSMSRIDQLISATDDPSKA
jgi:hypothetical protein